MNAAEVTYLHCEVVEDDVEMSLDQLCRACGTSDALVMQLVQHGVLDVRRGEAEGWLFVGASLRRTRVAVRLMRDLELNAPGVALVVELLDQIAQLRRGYSPALNPEALITGAQRS